MALCQVKAVRSSVKRTFVIARPVPRAAPVLKIAGRASLADAILVSTQGFLVLPKRLGGRRRCLTRSWGRCEKLFGNDVIQGETGPKKREWTREAWYLGCAIKKGPAAGALYHQ